MASRKNALAVGSALVKTVIVAVVGVFILAILWVQFGQIRFNTQKSYSAVFTSASGIQPASTVTASGVDVGRVDDIEVTDQNRAKVNFTIDASLPLTAGTKATIKFKNLTGDQYMDLTPGPGSTRMLPDGGVIPVSQTQPALDIDVLLGGFNPLLQGLQPAQVNQLSSEIVSVLQGQGGTINSVLAHAASFSGSLADQDQVIGSVITNLNTVLGGLDSHSAQLSDTVKEAADLVNTLSEDRKELLDKFAASGEYARGLGDLLAAVRTGHDTFEELAKAGHLFNKDAKEVNRILGLLPGAYLRLGRVSTNGAGYDFNACGVVLRLTGPDGKPFYTPQIGPSDNNLQCSSQDVAPLQGQGPTSAYGHEVEDVPLSDGQAVANDANDNGEHVDKHDQNPGDPNSGPGENPRQEGN
ncbi:MCE family protein [Pseudonocardia eucalypti]|uniref:MCE family protein n=1 Tax=Pseudonocardia eucalypti TaxID=648755 RepID=A0ABP9QJ61_9PSEU|nr:phospholipid/cholesterol/gamma-HCH transport system substrate-binding protein [Pseudonocardia eucalypti]